MTSDDKLLAAARDIFGHVAQRLDAPFSVELWDGTVVPLGPNADTELRIRLAGPGVISAVAKKPSLETIIRQYATGGVDFVGADMLTFIEKARAKKIRVKPRDLPIAYIIRRGLPFLFAPVPAEATSQPFKGRSDADFIRFHYDLGNDFYDLFLDPEMQYSCAYFTDWENSLEEAQADKIDMTCRKLRLAPGDRLLDIGCGWGGLLCHAAARYGVTAHGVTLSEEQYDYTLAKVKRLGLEGQVTVALDSYENVTGEYDKIASIGMYEHVGIANYPRYFSTLSRLLRDRGLLLNHGITRRARASRRRFRHNTPERKLMKKYVFPGFELDHIGHSVESMEAAGFEVHDVEGWREHYALTCRLWHRRLAERADDAIKLVGTEKYRIWLAYLAGVSYAFADGSLRIFQTVASKHAAKGPSGMPPTRAHLYLKDGK